MTDNRLAVGYAAKYVGQPDTTVIFQLPLFKEIAKIERFGREIDVHKHQSDLLGYTENKANDCKFGMGIASGESLQVLDVIALRGPCKWIQANKDDQKEFICCLQNWVQLENANAENEYLLPVYQRRKANHQSLIKVNHHYKSASLIHDFYIGTNDSVLHLVMDSETVYFSTQRKVGALHLSTGEKKWELELAREPSNVHDVFHIYAFDLSPNGRFLAAGGIAADEFANEEFVIVDTSTGCILYRTALSRRLKSLTKQASAIHAIKWHPSGWCAVGMSSGFLAHITLDGNIRAYKGSGKRIRALEFIDNNSTLLVGSEEKQFRKWRLLPDELGE